jgi:hypothetical protein
MTALIELFRRRIVWWGERMMEKKPRTRDIRCYCQVPVTGAMYHHQQHHSHYHAERNACQNCEHYTCTIKQAKKNDSSSFDNGLWNCCEHRLALLARRWPSVNNWQMIHFHRYVLVDTEFRHGVPFLCNWSYSRSKANGPEPSKVVGLWSIV